MPNTSIVIPHAALVPARNNKSIMTRDQEKRLMPRKVNFDFLVVSEVGLLAGGEVGAGVLDEGVVVEGSLSAGWRAGNAGVNGTS